MIYEWSLRWNKKMGKFFTSQEKGKIETCKKQASGTESRYYDGDKCILLYYFEVKRDPDVFALKFSCRFMGQKMSSTPS